MMKKKMTGLLTLALAASLTACGGGASQAPGTTAAKETQAQTQEQTTGASQTSEAAQAEEVYEGLEAMTIVLGASGSSTMANFTLQQEAADAINEKTGGKLTIDLNWDGVLGNDTALFESCMGGNVPLISMSTSSIMSYIPELAVFDCPAVFDSVDAAYEGVKDMKVSMDSLFEKLGIKLLDMQALSFRQLSTNTLLQSAEDFKGMTIRTLENKNHMAFWSNMGCTPTPLAMSDLYLSLQQGLVDAQDNSAVGIYSQKLYEIQDYYMAVNCFPQVNLIAINAELYDSLPAEYQECLVEFAQTYLAAAYENGAENEKQAIEDMGDGIEVLEVTEDMKAAFQEAAKPVWDSIASDIGDEIVDTYLAYGGKTR